MRNGKHVAKRFVKTQRQQCRAKVHYAEEWRILNDRFNGVCCAVSALK
jgi:hypothetical protein